MSISNVMQKQIINHTIICFFLLFFVIVASFSMKMDFKQVFLLKQFGYIHHMNTNKTDVVSIYFCRYHDTDILEGFLNLKRLILRFLIIQPKPTCSSISAAVWQFIISILVICFSKPKNGRLSCCKLHMQSLEFCIPNQCTGTQMLDFVYYQIHFKFERYSYLCKV